MKSEPVNGFPKPRRIASSGTFTHILRRGGCAADDRLVVFAMKRLGEADGPLPSRIGITIPKKAGNSPTRNRWKRHIREGFRLHRDRLPEGYDFIVRPKKDAVLDGPSIQKRLVAVMLRAIKRIDKS